MDLATSWEEFGWWVASQGQNFLRTLVLGWFYSGATWFLALTPFLGQNGALVVAFLLGEITGGAFAALSARLATRAPFAEYTVKRVLLARDFRTFGSRAGVVPDNMISYLNNHIWDGEAFLLSTLQESATLPAAETPRTLDQVSRVIGLDLIDKGSSDAFPWPTVEPFLQGLVAALHSPKVAGLLRDSLRDQFLRASPGYRKYVVNPRPGRLSQFLESRPWVLPLVSGIGIVLANLVVVVQFLTGRR
jgi:hypothetical protein